MKNVTISIDDDTLAWARVEAARQGVSLSKFVLGLMAAKRGASDRECLQVLDRFLQGPGYPGVSKDLPARDDLYDR